LIKATKKKGKKKKREGKEKRKKERPSSAQNITTGDTLFYGITPKRRKREKEKKRERRGKIESPNRTTVRPSFPACRVHL